MGYVNVGYISNALDSLFRNAELKADQRTSFELDFVQDFGSARRTYKTEQRALIAIATGFLLS